jgi:predicted dehydrogenase
VAYTVAIIGTGQMAGAYDAEKRPGEPGIYSHAGAYAAAGGFVMTTVCDTDAGRADAFVRRWGGHAAAGGIADILAGRHDVVSLCAPNPLHGRMLIDLLQARCCRAIFAEKPLALDRDEAARVCALSVQAGIPVVVNYQRRFDPVYAQLAERVRQGRVLAAHALYMKGVVHIGMTMLDALDSIFGQPASVLATARSWNADVQEFSYSFVLDYGRHHVSVDAAEEDGGAYAYHVFDIDILFRDGRVLLNDISRQIETREVTDYDYPGVRVLNDRAPQRAEAGYRDSMLGAARYIASLLEGAPHTINRPECSLQHMDTVAAIIQSHESGQRVRLKTS